MRTSLSQIVFGSLLLFPAFGERFEPVDCLLRHFIARVLTHDARCGGTCICSFRLRAESSRRSVSCAIRGASSSFHVGPHRLQVSQEEHYKFEVVYKHVGLAQGSGKHVFLVHYLFGRVFKPRGLVQRSGEHIVVDYSQS